MHLSCTISNIHGREMLSIIEHRHIYYMTSRVQDGNVDHLLDRMHQRQPLPYQTILENSKLVVIKLPQKYQYILSKLNGRDSSKFSCSIM